MRLASRSCGWSAPLLAVCAAALVATPPAALTAKDASQDGFRAVEIHYTSSEIALAEPALALHLAERFAKSARAALAEAVEEERRRLEQRRANIEGRPFFVTHTLERRDAAFEVFAVGENARRLISVETSEYVFQGGAHGFTRLDAVIWDVEAERPLPWIAFFEDGRPPDVLASAWRKAASAEQRARAGPHAWSEALDVAQAKLAETPVVFASSTVSGKAGGLVFLHEAYQLGPYVHGAYRITVPLEAFAQALSPDYAPFFAGAPIEE